MRKNGVDAAQILAIVMALPKNHPQYNKLIDLMNSTLIRSGTLPPKKEELFVSIIEDLQKEGEL